MRIDLGSIPVAGHMGSQKAVRGWDDPRGSKGPLTPHPAGLRSRMGSCFGGLRGMQSKRGGASAPPPVSFLHWSMTIRPSPDRDVARGQAMSL